MHQVRILDRQKKLKAVLSGASFKYDKAFNQANAIEIQIPRTVIEKNIPTDHSLYEFFNTQGKISYAEIAAFVKITKGDKTLVTGRIVGRQIGENVRINALTEECLLEANLTPTQYGAVWEGWDLADLARDLIDGWEVLRVKDKEELEMRIVASSNVDLTTEPGTVMLAKRSNGRYYESGYITLKFNRAEVLNFKSWDRFRWSADSDGEEGAVQTTIQISLDGTTWTEPFDGGIPEEVGYSVLGTSESVFARINLITNDTESEDPEGKAVGVTPRVFACELIARTEGGLLVTGIPEIAGVTVKDISADYSNALKVLVESSEKLGWEFSVLDGVLNLAEKLGVDRTREFVFRASTNIQIVNLGDDDSSLVNVLTAFGPGSGINRLQTTLRNWESIAKFGEYPGSHEFEVNSLSELKERAKDFLEEQGFPKMIFEIIAAFPSGQEPSYGLGDTVKVVIPTQE